MNTMFPVGAAALALALHLLTWISAAAKPTAVFPVTGNVYPQGQYHTTIKIGDSDKEYIVDIDTGSDLTWLQCDIPGAHHTPTINPLYVPVNVNGKDPSQVVSCMHHTCLSLQPNGVPNCGDDQHCHYEVQYADSGSSLGVLVFDNLHLPLSDATTQTALVALGCGYDQEFPGTPPAVDGILGLGKGKSGILNQLQSFGVMDNIVAHCLGAQGGGYLTFGGVPSFDNTEWKSVPTESKYYAMGSADLYSDNRADPVSTKLQVILDSGSTYTYFSSQAYQDLLTQIKADLGNRLVVAADDNTLPVCWNGAQPFTLITEAATYFQPLYLTISDNGDNSRFQMDPESYLILSRKGNVCLGILNGGGVGIGEELSVIGDISMQDKWIIYDNKNSRVGWVAANCSLAPQF